MNPGFIFVIGAAALLFFGLQGGKVNFPGSSAIAGALSRVLPAAKLGNADPNFEPWLASEVTMLLGQVNKSAAFRQADLDALTGAIRDRHLPTDPSGTDANPGALLRTTVCGGHYQTGVGLTVARGIGIAAAPIPVVGQIVGAFTGIFSAILGGHARAAAQEQATLCSTIPAANQALDQLDQSYQAGQTSGAQMKTALEELFLQFQSANSAIAQPQVFDAAQTIAAHHCNEACKYERMLRGIIDAKVLFDY